jgi:hypothetical protein
VTNKHVIEGASVCTLIFTLADAQGRPINTIHHRVDIPDIQLAWKFHPDDSVDLCAMPIATIIKILQSKGINPFYVPFDNSFIPNDLQRGELNSLEEIVMIGYPDGLWDSVNNKPIFRKGITATHANIDYEGKKEFLIDAACFPGSSGSPVVIYNEFGYHDGKQFKLGIRRLLLIGILYAGPQHVVVGNTRVIEQAKKTISVSNIPNNLGCVIKSERLSYFDELFTKELAQI